MNFTQEQDDAIHIHDRHLIVTAGAGSGKTRVLVERFIALLDHHPDWTLPSIVAITFTEKAAREMRDRVRSAVEDRLRSAVDSGGEAALIRWLDHQAALTRARIGTIHGLCASILRANPAEAQIDPGFEVLDENEAAILRDDAVETVLARLVAEDHPAAALLAAYDLREVRKVLRRYAERSKAQAISEVLYPAGGEPPSGPESALLARWDGDWEALTAAVMRQEAGDDELYSALGWIEPEDLPSGDKLSDVWRIVHTQRSRLLGDSVPDFAGAVEVLAAGIKLNVGSASNWGGKEGLAESKAQLRLIRERAEALQKVLLARPGERDAEAARWLVLWSEAIQLASETYEQMKQERGLLDFDDLEARARDLLTRHPAAAARYADPVDGEFKHILVDEFQDTNAAQRDIIYALAGIGLPGSETGSETGSEGRLFVVGDPKQSIYAFRGADVSVFGQVREDLVARGGVELPLSTSFRTHHNLVMAFNDLFGRILSAGSGESFDLPVGRGYEVDLGKPMAAFRPSAPEITPEHACPLAVIALQKPDTDSDQKVDAEMLRRAEAEEIARHIHALVQQETRVWDRESGEYRAMQYGDAAILFQAMTQVPLYEEVFKAAGLPYVTVAGRGYYDRQEVWDLLNLLRALYNPADDLVLASALRSPLFGLSDEALFALRLMRDDQNKVLPHKVLPLWEALFTDPASPLAPLPETWRGESGALDLLPLSNSVGEGDRGVRLDAADVEARRFACTVLRELRDLAGRATVADLLTRVLNLTGYQAVLTGLADGARRRGNVEKLVALARESGRISLGAFLNYAHDLTAREVREGEAAVEVEGAVTLMSVHASKGLEFPVVVLADASWGRQRADHDLFKHDLDVGPVCRLPITDPDEKEPDLFAWKYAGLAADRRERAERRRLLYVGATRAQEYLIVTGSLAARSGERSWLRQWLAALGLEEEDLGASDETQVLSYEWGGCALRIPLTLNLPDDRPRRSESGAVWDDPAVAAGQPVAGVEPELPPLLAEIPIEPTAPARFLTPTQVARLGRATFYDPTARGWKLFRHSVLYDAPEPLRPLPDPVANVWDSRRLVGELVHRMLRAWLLPSTTPRDTLESRLRTYAWESGLSDEFQIAEVTQKAMVLLEEFDRSDTRARIERASPVYRELPFMYHWGARTIQGRIDVLYLDRNQWYVLDYKTAPVSPNGVYRNAKQHYLQVGMYALAVEARTGQTPQTQLYYIHPARLLMVQPEQWRPALERLEDDLRTALARES